MKPDDEAQRENPFPQGYEHLEDWMQTVEGRLQQLDAELNQSYQTPALTYEMPSLGGTSTKKANLLPPRRDTDVIRKEKEDLKADMYKSVEKETENADKDTKTTVQGMAFSRIYREDINKLRDAERGLPAYDSAWTLDRGQVTLHEKLKNHHERERGAQREKSATPDARRPTDIEPSR